MQACRDKTTTYTRPRSGEWYREDLADHDWLVDIPDEVVDELDAGLRAAASAQARAVPSFTATAAFTAGVRQRLLRGSGVVVARGLPVERWRDAERLTAVSILGHLTAPIVEQTFTGVTLYDVRDTGRRLAPGVRRSVTNLDQPFHSDGPWVQHPPWIVALYCLQAAEQGGASSCISVRALVRDLERESPELAARLHEPFFWDRQGEHAPEACPFSRQPMVWEEDGRWSARFYADYIVKGYALAGTRLDPLGRRALERIGALSHEPHRRLEFTLQPGDIEWVNNRTCAHARTGFEPLTRARRRRHLVRVWHRLHGATALDG